MSLLVALGSCIALCKINQPSCSMTSFNLSCVNPSMKSKLTSSPRPAFPYSPSFMCSAYKGGSIFDTQSTTPEHLDQLSCSNAPLVHPLKMFGSSLPAKHSICSQFAGENANQVMHPLSLLEPHPAASSSVPRAKIIVLHSRYSNGKNPKVFR